MLPEGFCQRMKKLLGDEYGKFAAALEQPSVKAVRVNKGKVSADHLSEICSLGLEPLPYTDVGFIARNTDGIGRTPEHHSGMIYVQDPGAMATVSALDVREGWWVLDACAAPGGKSTQLSALIGDDGFLLANEYVPKRAKIIVGNMERLGVKNATVTSLDTADLADMFSEAFDLVLCDAPCSGEGMFRKYDEALEEWSEENVALCAARQGEILDNLSGLVKPGGYLLYSTCTYSLEENELAVAAFISRHPEYTLVPVTNAVRSCTAPGIDSADVNLCNASYTRRFYPHLSEGEGQFIALMYKSEANPPNLKTILYKNAEESPSKEEITVVEKFFSENLISRPKGRLVKHGEYVCIIPHGCPLPPRSVFMAGVTVGEVKKGMLFPHHQLFSAYGDLFRKRESICADDPRIAAYLHGEEIAAADVTGNGWCCVCYEGAPLGGGKLSGGRIKNHYPKGLRNN